MPGEPTPSFTLEIPLATTAEDERVLSGRLEAAKRVFNATLGDTLEILEDMRGSADWAEAKALPKPGSTEQDEASAAAKRKALAAAFHECRKLFGFSLFDIEKIATQHKNDGGFSSRLGAHETQKLAARIFSAADQYLFGARGRPRFKGVQRPLHSVEGKSNSTGMRWSQDSGTVSWAGLRLVAKIPSKTRDPYLHEALECRTKYCRVLWRQVKGRRRWYLQLIQEGMPPAKYMFQVKGSPENLSAVYSTVGLDIGPSTIAISATSELNATPTLVALVPLAPSVDPQYKEIRKIQRAMDRSRRATNPENYNKDGTIRKVVRNSQGKRVKKTWCKSSRYKVLQAELADEQRKMAATRKRDHGQLVNQIVGTGATVKTETLSYVALQKNYGRSVQTRAPGTLIANIQREAESAGGKMETLNTRALRMSQYDHKSGSYEKKPLSQRWHILGGSEDVAASVGSAGEMRAAEPLETLVQRDAYSSFLAENAEGDQHNPVTLERAWQTAESLFRRAGLCVDRSTSGQPVRVPAIAATPLSLEWIARQKRHRRARTRGEHPASAPEALVSRTLWIYP